PNDTDDAAYLIALRSTLTDALARAKPELILFQAGCDPLKEDTLGKLALSREGLRRRNAIVFDHVAYWDVPVVVFMGGGYADPIERSVACHADVFEQLAMHCHGQRQ
ncbi:MAG: histone deacetylase, partial [Leptospiraceae bacterium]|nr:histone deacetylase [Leptospiraceae bacterium]